jgi:hypothetical protein
MAKPCQIVDITENRVLHRGDGMGSNMQQSLAEENDRCLVARRIFKALCALYPDRYLMLALPSDDVVLPGDVICDPPPAAALAAQQSPAAL